MLGLKKLKHLKHLGKISKNLGDIAFELKWMRDLIEREIDRKEGNFLAADRVDSYDQKIEFDLEQGKEIEETVKNILDIEDEMQIAAMTPRTVYTVKGEDHHDNTE
jgi:hypothetical protein